MQEYSTMDWGNDPRDKEEVEVEDDILMSLGNFELHTESEFKNNHTEYYSILSYVYYKGEKIDKRSNGSDLIIQPWQWDEYKKQSLVIAFLSKFRNEFESASSLIDDLSDLMNIINDIPYKINDKNKENKKSVKGNQ